MGPIDMAPSLPTTRTSFCPFEQDGKAKECRVCLGVTTNNSFQQALTDCVTVMNEK